MPLRVAVAETLDTWREAERLLEELPPLSPDHETVAAIVVECRATYQRLAFGASRTADALASARSTLDHAHALLREVRSRADGACRHQGNDAPSPVDADGSASVTGGSARPN